ncbi:PDZ domain-containing protein [Microbacterium sediminicola]|uniref:PDZ domain-containing protein n=1 Tax=Microbacterium sediminicola TaxID=415210 RepID=A0ABN2HNA5_9MICO
MALFDENVTVVPAPRRRRSRGTQVGLWALVVALVTLLALTFLPTSYVIEQPGPVYNTLGTVQTSDGETVPLIEVAGAPTYETSGALDLLTVQVAGSPERRPSWFELAMAWFDPSRAIVPIESVFPSGVTSEERSEVNAALMVDSQAEATAAALTELGYDVGTAETVYSVGEGSAADGVLVAGDVIVAVGGQDVADVQQIRDLVQDADGAAVAIDILRDGTPMTVSLTPAFDSESDAWLIGVTLTTEYDFPVDVTIQLDNVGGPSAGMMFALGIMDVMTPDQLNGGAEVAGTGTITADGVVGAIGGIRQKLWGALNAGAEYFLAPDSNCDEVAGNVPGDLQVFAVATLDDALAALDAIRTDADLSALPTCG